MGSLLSGCDKEVAEKIQERLESIGEHEFGSGQFRAEFQTAEEGMAAFSGRPARPEFDCASFSHDSTSKKVTLDFGNNPCEGKDGKKRSGTMIITYGGNIRNPDEHRVVVFSDYKVDSVLLNGTYTYTPLDTTQAGKPTVSVKIEDASIALDRGKTYSFEVDRTWVWTEGMGSQSTSDDEWEVTGTATGTSGNGKEYTMTIDDNLLYKTSCWSQDIFYAVSGTVEVQENRKTYLVDYGSSSCDKEVSITVGKATWTQELP